MEHLQTEKALLIWREGDLIKDQWILHDAASDITIGPPRESDRIRTRPERGGRATTATPSAMTRRCWR